MFKCIFWYIDVVLNAIWTCIFDNSDNYTCDWSTIWNFIFIRHTYAIWNCIYGSSDILLLSSHTQYENIAFWTIYNFNKLFFAHLSDINFSTKELREYCIPEMFWNVTELSINNKYSSSRGQTINSVPGWEFNWYTFEILISGWMHYENSAFHISFWNLIPKR